MYIRFDTPCISEKNYISADNAVVFLSTPISSIMVNWPDKSADDGISWLYAYSLLIASEHGSKYTVNSWNKLKRCIASCDHNILADLVVWFSHRS